MNAIVGAIAPVVGLVADLIGGVLAAAVGALATVIKEIVPYITAFFYALRDGVQMVVDWVRSLFGIADSPGTKAGGGVGMAARQASTGSVESVLQKARESAFSLGMGAKGEDPTSIAKEIAKKTDLIYQDIKALVEPVKKIAEWVTGKAEAAKAVASTATTTATVAPAAAPLAFNPLVAPWIAAKETMRWLGVGSAVVTGKREGSR